MSAVWCLAVASALLLQATARDSSRQLRHSSPQLRPSARQLALQDATLTDDAVIIDAAASTGRWRRSTGPGTGNDTRDGKQMWFTLAEQVIRIASSPESHSKSLKELRKNEEPFGLECETSMGRQGVCKTFRDCYPYFKVSDLGAWDGWALGHYDTCSFVSGDNMEIFGVCCTEPVTTPPQQWPDLRRTLPPAQPAPLPPHQHFGLSPASLLLHQLSVRQVPAQWPPPIPTHPPHHTAPTHPPALGMPTLPPPRPPMPGWPHITMKPTATITTAKPSWPPALPTHPALPAKPAPVKPPVPVADMPVDSSCGAKNGAQTYELQDQERIVGGHSAELNEWPWIVALFNNGRQFCGGSLIDQQHVLSAAHCVAHMTSFDVARLTARLGEHNILTSAETQHVERKIKRVVRHRGFDMRTLYNDISLLTLDQPVQFSRTIRPVCLPSGGRAYAGLTATVIGWGSLREGGNQPHILQEVTIPIWSNAECRLKYGLAAPGGIVDHMLCAGRAAMDSCSGDSGGPLMVQEGSRWNQVGVVSWGIGCGKGQYPGVYTRVTHFLPWIQKNSAK